MSGVGLLSLMSWLTALLLFGGVVLALVLTHLRQVRERSKTAVNIPGCYPIMFVLLDFTTMDFCLFRLTY